MVKYLLLSYPRTRSSTLYDILSPQLDQLHVNSKFIPGEYFMDIWEDKRGKPKFVYPLLQKNFISMELQNRCPLETIEERLKWKLDILKFINKPVFIKCTTNINSLFDQIINYFSDYKIIITNRYNKRDMVLSTAVARMLNKYHTDHFYDYSKIKLDLNDVNWICDQIKIFKINIANIKKSVYYYEDSIEDFVKKLGFCYRETNTIDNKVDYEKIVINIEEVDEIISSYKLGL